MCPSPTNSMNKATPHLMINQSGHSAGAGGMVTAMMAVSLAEGLITTKPADGVFNFDAATGKGGIEGNILGWTGFAARLTAGGSSQSLRMEVADTNVGQVAQTAHASGQSFQQLGFFQDGQVGRWSRHTVSNIHNLAGYLLVGGDDWRV